MSVFWGSPGSHSPLTEVRGAELAPSCLFPQFLLCCPQRYTNCTIRLAAGHLLALEHHSTLWGTSRPQGPHLDPIGHPLAPGALSSPYRMPPNPRNVILTIWGIL